jgi:hypothetical protein
MNEAARNVKAETENPQKQHYNENCPKHFFYLIYSCVALCGLSWSPLNDLPHSKQDRFARGVIKPQNGHIRCAPKSGEGRSAGVSNLLKESAQKTKRLRSRSRNGTPDVFQSLTFVYSSNNHNWTRRTILCWIAHNGASACVCPLSIRQFFSAKNTCQRMQVSNMEVSNSDQLTAAVPSTMDFEQSPGTNATTRLALRAVITGETHSIETMAIDPWSS